MAADLSHVRSGYDRWAVVYDHDANPLQALEEPIVREALGNVRGLIVLDLGCGTGRHAIAMAAAGADVTAIDFSAGMLAEARTKPGAESTHFLEHDLQQMLPFSDTSFDRVVSGLVLEHIHDLFALFREARRVLKPDGRVVLSTMHPAMFLRGTQARFTDPASGELISPGSIPHTVCDFIMAAIRAGFTIDNAAEFSADASLAARYPRAEKYVGWPMLLVLTLSATIALPTTVE